MDPNANLREQREIYRAIIDIQNHADEGGNYTGAQERQLQEHAERLADLVEALDQWMSACGFLPAAWSAGR